MEELFDILNISKRCQVDNLIMEPASFIKKFPVSIESVVELVSTAEDVSQFPN